MSDLASDPAGNNDDYDIRIDFHTLAGTGSHAALRLSGHPLLCAAVEAVHGPDFVPTFDTINMIGGEIDR